MTTPHLDRPWVPSYVGVANPPPAQTCTRAESQANQSGLTGGVIYACRVSLGIGAYTTVTLAKGTTVGSGLANSFLALYDSSGAKLATSADLSAGLVSLAVSTTGTFTLNYTTTVADDYFLAFLIGSGTTPTFNRAPETHPTLYVLPPIVAGTHSSVGQTSMPNNITITSTNGTRLFWMMYS